jgi:hypothetical protein
MVLAQAANGNLGGGRAMRGARLSAIAICRNGAPQIS